MRRHDNNAVRRTVPFPDYRGIRRSEEARLGLCDPDDEVEFMNAALLDVKERAPQEPVSSIYTFQDAVPEWKEEPDFNVMRLGAFMVFRKAQVKEVFLSRFFASLPTNRFANRGFRLLCGEETGLIRSAGNRSAKALVNAELWALRVPGKNSRDYFRRGRAR